MKYLYYFVILIITIIASIYVFFIRVPKESLTKDYYDDKKTYLNTISLIDSLSSDEFTLRKRIDNHYYVTIHGCGRIIHFPEGELISDCLPLSKKERILVFEIIHNMKVLDVALISKRNDDERYASHIFRVGSYFPNAVAEIVIYNKNQDFTGHSNIHKIEDNVFLETGAHY